MEIKFKWTSDISVNDEIIDAQHKELLNQINILLDAVFNEKDISIVKETVNFLENYIHGHLEYEEEYMERHFYPELSHHKEIHDKFNQRYTEFKNRLEISGPTKEMFSEVETFLGNWWIHHIGHEDRKYAEFIKENE